MNIQRFSRETISSLLSAALLFLFIIGISACSDDDDDTQVETFGEGSVGTPVDLGLSVRWASWNIGGNAPADYGKYFQWGATSESEPFADILGLAISATEHDAARVIWGGSWRMPTSTEFLELLDPKKCSWSWTSKVNSNGNTIYGYLITSLIDGYAGNSIFLPASGEAGWSIKMGSVGFLWSGSMATRIDSKGTTVAYGLDFLENNFSIGSNTLERRFPIRPVMDR